MFPEDAAFEVSGEKSQTFKVDAISKWNFGRTARKFACTDEYLKMFQTIK